jgi:hypothetical protein
MMTSTTLVTVTSLAAFVKVPATPVAAPSSNLKSKTHQPKPYDIVHGMKRVIDMMKETLDLRESPGLNAGRVAPQDLPLRLAAI